jgi:quercetin dioxygenase-like cupin family protein
MAGPATPRIRVRTVSEWTPLSPGVMARCLLEERGTALMLYRMEAGRQFAPHEHATAELGVVLSGEGRLLLATERRSVRAGDTFFVGPGTSHGFETFADRGEAVVLNAVCPAHLDDPRPLIEAIWGWSRENLGADDPQSGPLSSTPSPYVPRVPPPADPDSVLEPN